MDETTEHCPACNRQGLLGVSGKCLRCERGVRRLIVPRQPHRYLLTKLERTTSERERRLRMLRRELRDTGLTRRYSTNATVRDALKAKRSELRVALAQIEAWYAAHTI